MDYITQANAALEKRAAIFEARKAVLDDKTLTAAAKQTRAQAMDSDMDALEAEAKSYVKEHEVRQLTANAAAQTTGNGHVTRDARAQADELRALSRGATKVAVFDLRAAESVGGVAGNTVPRTFVAEVQEALADRSVAYSLARKVVTTSGELLDYPVKNLMVPGAPLAPKAPATAFRIAENTAIAKTQAEWSKVTISAYKYAAIAQATVELVEDSGLDFVQILGRDLGTALAMEFERDLMLGDGTGDPQGLVVASAAGKTVANTAAINMDAIIDLQHSITPPYRKNATFLVNDTVVSTLRKLKDTTNNYLWQPSTVAGQPDTLMGKPVFSDPHIAPPGASAKVAVYGDYSHFLVRVVRGIRVVRSDEYGWDADLVSFKGSVRLDSRLLDANASKTLVTTAA
jgi:HK97 family phage major capsid protein